MEMRRLLAEADQTGFAKATDLRLGQYLDQWLGHASQRLTSRTVANYRTMIERHIRPTLGNVPLKDLQPLQVQELYDNRYKSGRCDGRGGLSARSVVVIHAVLRAALKQAVKWQMIPHNVADAVTVPKQPRRQLVTLDQEGAQKLLQAVEGHRDYALIATALYTGLRRGELLGLHWTNVDLEGSRLQVTQALVKLHGAEFVQPKTSRSRRTVTLSPPAVDILRQVRRTQDAERLRLGPAYHDNGLVFTNLDGSIIDPSSATHRFADLARDAGFPGLRFHDLRHTHATMLLRKNVHPKVVQERLGHSQISVTLDTYSHVLPGMQEEALAKLGDILWD